MVEVVGEPYADAAFGRRDESAPHDVYDCVPQPEVVEGEVQAPSRQIDERRDRVGDLQGGLPAVGEGPELEAGRAV